MAKVSLSPIVSGISGSIGGNITFGRRKNGFTVYAATGHSDRKSPAQLSQRQKYKAACAQWRALTQEERERWSFQTWLSMALKTVIDGAPPLVTLNSLQDSSTSAYRLEGTFADDVGVVGLEYRLDGGLPTQLPVVSPFSAELTLSEGENTLEVYATDAAGNVGTAQQTVTYTRPWVLNPEDRHSVEGRTNGLYPSFYGLAQALQTSYLAKVSIYAYVEGMWTCEVRSADGSTLHASVAKALVPGWNEFELPDYLPWAKDQTYRIRFVPPAARQVRFASAPYVGTYWRMDSCFFEGFGNFAGSIGMGLTTAHLG